MLNDDENFQYSFAIYEIILVSEKLYLLVKFDEIILEGDYT